MRQEYVERRLDDEDYEGEVRNEEDGRIDSPPGHRRNEEPRKQQHSGGDAIGHERVQDLAVRPELALPPILILTDLNGAVPQKGRIGDEVERQLVLLGSSTSVVRRPVGDNAPQRRRHGDGGEQHQPSEQ